MVGNNYLFKSFIPSIEDYIIIEGNNICLNDINYINIGLPNSALIAVLAPLTIQSNLSAFRYKGAIELQPIECELNGKLHINGDIVNCKVIKIFYQSSVHKYMLYIKFNLVDLKTYKEHMEITKKQKVKLIDKDMELGEILDLG